MNKVRLMRPGRHGQLINEFGIEEKPPSDWAFLPAGDAAITRKTSTLGPSWRVQIKKGRRTQSLGIWAPQEHISRAKTEVAQMRSAPNYEKKKASAAKSRNNKQIAYVAEFEQAVAKYLNFHEQYRELESVMTRLVTEHAIPVGSGTVARTQMIPLEQRAAKAVIAWMRHRTTDYDTMKIPRIKGQRRAVRRMLADGSVKVLKQYRLGKVTPEECPLWKVLNSER